ncbi:hypothetical protein, variant [Saprolegnia diclina VS20]|uniref:Uncharacterized protein n=1 Tax=Saprolegnia diclina (strain VS20) TaxID=1156394 RepID=T0QGE3_SAPDV|nr:hypothetical protein, variant [Saprolegnia diclina VS20]XP_008613844.1 hypothetical protein SDRG_09673 [Saprolegnia diclina VS20]EQC32699.1 hypothetical protein SDRG_09673 [Saprolegnia diclina VS20]EQC32700.1 hypothetical protein, variant [Saprolegnia diclina VS20]|eukprot:XP_008613843.1 hypothetical protein, variant [Saprolegnia diclina VS20]
MGSGASSAHVHRRRLLLKQHNEDPTVLSTERLALALTQCVSDQRGAILLPEIATMLTHEYGLHIAIDELLSTLQRLGCACENSTTGASITNTAPLVAFLAPKDVAPPTPPTIWVACKLGHLDVVQTLLQDGVSAWSERDAFDNLPIYYASLCGHKDIVALLLSCYANSKDVTLSEADRLRCATNALRPDIKRCLHSFAKATPQPRSLLKASKRQQRKEAATSSPSKKKREKGPEDDDADFEAWVSGWFGDE